jgi:hypothetical protein
MWGEVSPRFACEEQFQRTFVARSDINARELDGSETGHLFNVWQFCWSDA